MFKKVFGIAIFVFIFGINANCEGMLAINVDTKKLTAVVGGMETLGPVQCELVGSVLRLQVPLSSSYSLSFMERTETETETKLQSFLDSLQGQEFGFSPLKEEILEGDGFSRYLSKLGATSSELFYSCSIEQKERLINGMTSCIPFLVHQYLTYPEECSEYFDNAMNGVVTVINMLSNVYGNKNNYNASKSIALELIRQGKNSFQKTETSEKVKMRQKYGENIVKRVVGLLNLLENKKLDLTVDECKSIVSYLDNDLMVEWSLLSDLYAKGMSLLLNQFEMYTYIDLHNGMEFLNKFRLNIEQLKNESEKLVYYIAVLYCLNYQETLHFPLSVYDAYDDVEAQEKKRMLASAKEILDSL